MAKRYSRYFGVPAKEFERMGVFNAFIDQDSKFHVDPLLLRGSRIPEFEEAYDAFLDYFRAFIPLVKHVQVPTTQDRFFKKMVERFTFPELQYTGLGYSEGNSQGTGISGKLSIQLAKSAYEIIKAGYEDPEIFALMPLIEEKIGPDRISDMTIAILRPHFLAYTQRIASELGLEIFRYRLAYDLYFNVPIKGGDAIHFVPKVFLNDLPIATSYDEIADAANYNERLKARLGQVIGASWNEYSKFTKYDWKRVILNERDCYNAAINYYRSIKGIPYNFDSDIHDKYWDLKLARLVEQNPIQFISNIFKSDNEKVFKWTMDICEKFRHLVEENRMSEILHRNKRTPDETDWQLILFMIADAYIDGGHLDMDLTRENNPGNGEVDFKFSLGKAKTIVEIKKSSNPDILHGYRVQLPAYMRAEQTNNGVFIVIIDKPEDEEVIKKKLDDVIEDMITKEERVSPVVYVRGYHQTSASKSGYVL